MAIAYRGSVSNRNDPNPNGADVALDLTTISGLAQNDIVIVAYAIGDNDNTDVATAIAVGSGWTQIADLFSRDATAPTDVNLGVFWKRMGASVDTSVTVDGLNGADASVAAVAMAFSGVDTTTALDVTTTTNTGIDSANADAPSIDWSTAGTAVVIALGASQQGGGAATFTFPTNYTTNAVQISSDDTTDCTVGIGYRLNPSDPEDPGAATHSATSNGCAWAAATIALRAAGVTAESKTGDDTGTLTEARPTIALSTQSDTGTAGEGQPAIAESASEAGALAEAGSGTAAVSSADTGTGAEDAALTAVATTDTDTGTAADTGTAGAITADTDTGTLDDTAIANASASKTGTDDGTLAEDAALTDVVAAGVDTGTLAEAGVGAAVAVGSDTGTLDDTGVVVPLGGTTPDDTDAFTLADDESLTVTAMWADGVDAATLADTGASYASAPSGDGTDTVTLDDTGVVVETTISVTPVVAVPSTSYTMMMPRTKDFLMPRGSEKWLLREEGVVEITPVAPATPPDPFGWLAEIGDEDFQVVALLG